MALSVKIKIGSVLGVYVFFDITNDEVRRVTLSTFISPINGGQCYELKRPRPILCTT